MVVNRESSPEPLTHVLAVGVPPFVVVLNHCAISAGSVEAESSQLGPRGAGGLAVVVCVELAGRNVTDQRVQPGRGEPVEG